MLKKTGFHIGWLSFFRTSVLHTGMGSPASTIFDINKKGSCKYKTKPLFMLLVKSLTKEQEIRLAHTLLENRSFCSKFEHFNIISVVVFELMHSSACTISCPQRRGLPGIVGSSLYTRSKVNDLLGLVTTCTNRHKTGSVIKISTSNKLLRSFNFYTCISLTENKTYLILI